ncbi:MAG: VWA domain-containing protein [Candidatus Promineofilum sp.]|jgi:Ca-activated chloride channel family protein|nr:VWA domain-containing protein [Promineifilum sp.]
MTGEVIIKPALNRPRFPTLESEQAAYLYLEAQPVAGVAAVQAPLNLALVLDRSGSMAGQKIRDLRQAARLTLDRLGPDDLVSLVLFDDNVDVLAAARPAADRAALLAQIERIDERGGTQMSLGLQAGLAQLRAGLGPDRVSRLVLLTDGETWDDEDRCRELAQQAAALGAPITALGLGDEWNQALLTDLADLSGGNWEFIDTPDRIVAAFQQVVVTMQRTVVTNATLILRLVRDVQPRGVWRVRPLIDRLSARAVGERDVQVALGDLQSEGQSVLIELSLPPRAPGDYRLAQAEVNYDVPGGGAGLKATADIIVTFTADAATAVNGAVMNTVERVTAFKLMTRALDEREAADAGQRTQRLRAAATRLLDAGEIQLAQEAQAAAAQIDAGQTLSPHATKRLVSATRKLDMSDLG